MNQQRQFQGEREQEERQQVLSWAFSEAAELARRYNDKARPEWR